MKNVKNATTQKNKQLKNTFQIETEGVVAPYLLMLLLKSYLETLNLILT